MKSIDGYMRWLLVLLFYVSLCSSMLVYIRDNAYLWICVFTAVLLIIGLVKSRGSTPFKALLFNLLVITLSLGLTEAYYAGLFSSHQGITLKGTYSTRHKEYICADNIRGYTTRKNYSADAQCYKDGQLVYNVRYDTNALGLRVTPKDFFPEQYPLSQKHQNIVFFGCSFTYGEGVQDNQTMPYLVEKLSKGKLRSYNLACHGYGPHQMLRTLETGQLDEIITDQKPAIAVYQGIMAHINRCTGNYPYITWGWNDPRYLLDSMGNVTYSGTFQDSRGGKLRNCYMLAMLNKSSLFHQLVTPKLLGWKVTQNDRLLYIKIIERSKQLFEEKYGGQFYVLFWPQSNDDCTQLIKELKSRQIKVITTPEIFFRYNEPSGDYFLADSHPNPMAHERIAEYFVNRFSPPVKTKKD